MSLIFIGINCCTLSSPYVLKLQELEKVRMQENETLKGRFILYIPKLCLGQNRESEYCICVWPTCENGGVV